MSNMANGVCDNLKFQGARRMLDRDGSRSTVIGPDCIESLPLDPLRKE